MLHSQIKEAFTQAIANEDNWVDGKINVNFVNADVYMDVPNSLENSETVDKVFDELIDKFFVDVPADFC